MSLTGRSGAAAERCRDLVEAMTAEESSTDEKLTKISVGKLLPAMMKGEESASGTRSRKG